jgi:Skp family chaperone for outer membrane proteins
VNRLFTIAVMFLLVANIFPKNIFAADKEVNWSELTPEQAMKKWRLIDPKSETRKNYEKKYKERTKRLAESKKLREKAQTETTSRTEKYQKFIEIVENEREEKELFKKEQTLYEKQQLLYCNQLIDKVKNYEEYRTRWYKLNDQGERVYLSEKEVNSNYKALKVKIKIEC